MPVATSPLVVGAASSGEGAALVVVIAGVVLAAVLGAGGYLWVKQADQLSAIAAQLVIANGSITLILTSLPSIRKRLKRVERDTVKHGLLIAGLQSVHTDTQRLAMANHNSIIDLTHDNGAQPPHGPTESVG